MKGSRVEISSDVEVKSCFNCDRQDAESWVFIDDKSYCPNCSLSIYNVEYNNYLQHVLSARNYSRELARDKGTSEELIGHCRRNAASLLTKLESDPKIPSEIIYLCTGSAEHQSVGNSVHYWVCLRSGDQTIHIDAEVYKGNGGLWIDSQKPSNYSIREFIPISESYRFPEKVKEWYRKA